MVTLMNVLSLGIRSCVVLPGSPQVLEQFLDKGEEMEYAEPEAFEKARYALWRAAELRKAIREGRPPAPPPEPADVAAAVAGAAAEGAYGSSGGGADGGGSGGGGADLFAGPAYDIGGFGAPTPPPAAPPLAGEYGGGVEGGG